MGKFLPSSHVVSAMVLGTMIWCGCSQSQKSGRPEVEQTPPEELYGASTKATLYEFRAKVRKHGVSAAKQELPQLLENFESYEKRPVGQHLDTYKQIAEKLTAMQGSLGSANRESVVKTANEIGDLAEKLPGKADANPEVE